MEIAYDTYITERTRIDGTFTQTLAIESNYPIIEMSISCTNLFKHDLTSKHNTMCVLFTKQNNAFTETSRTEIVLNNSNPQFIKQFKTLYVFESYQPLRFEIYNTTANNSILKYHDLIGYCETTVQYVVSHMDKEIALELEHDDKNGCRGHLLIKGQQTKDSNAQMQGQIYVKDLKKVKTFAKNNPFFEILKFSETGCEIPVYRSEVSHKSFSCSFKKFSLIMQSLCNGSLDNQITIKFYDYRKNKEPFLIGSCKNTVNYFIESVGSFQEIKSDVTEKKVGEFTFKNIEIVQTPTFVDYLRSGIKLTMITSIDFSCFKENISLHHISKKKDSNSMNEYEKCISSVGSILTKYDANQEFEVYGFGLRVNDSEVKDYFPLSFEKVKGLNGILEAYQKSLEIISFSVPCNLEPTITNVAEKAISLFEHSKIYTILLILTSGNISDIQKTKDAIVKASDAPLNIIIVGLGNDDFSLLEQLDADVDPIVSSNGQKMKRDIVQFVPFRKFKKLAAVSLEQEVLAEIPNQIHQYCAMHNYKLNLPKNDLF